MPLLTLVVESTRATIVGTGEELLPPLLVLAPPVLVAEPDATVDISGEVGELLLEQAARVASDASMTERVRTRADIGFPDLRLVATCQG